MRNTVLAKLVEVLSFFDRNHKAIINCPAMDTKCCDFPVPAVPSTLMWMGSGLLGPPA